MEQKSNHPTILVVEDNELIRLCAAGLLEDHGYTVMEAKNAEEALKVMEDHKDVRLLFTDIQMPPGIDGLDLARLVHDRWPKVLLIITSGQVQPTRGEIADHGHFIEKPYKEGVLLDQVDDMIEKDDKKH